MKPRCQTVSSNYNISGCVMKSSKRHAWCRHSYVRIGCAGTTSMSLSSCPSPLASARLWCSVGTPMAFHQTQTSTGLSSPSGNMMDESLLTCSPNLYEDPSCQDVTGKPWMDAIQGATLFQ